MRRSVLTILVAAAVFGYSFGSVHSPWMARWNIVKFPVLLLLTAGLCGLAFHAFTLVVTRRIPFLDLMRVSLCTYADLSILLASLAPISYFLALTLEQPEGQSLNEYPMFLALNVVFIGAGGTLALGRQALRLTRVHELIPPQTAVVVVAWLAISLFTGGQVAWYMRPWFGPSTIPDHPVLYGTEPDYRGATNFYEAVYHIAHPPPLPENYTTRPRDR